MNLYEQQRANRRNTVLVVALFLMFFCVLGLGFDVFLLGFHAGGGAPARRAYRGGYYQGGYYEEDSGAGIAFPIATTIALLIGGGQAWWGLRSGDKAVLTSSHAVPVDPGTQDPQERQLLNVVEEMKIAAGLPMPQVYIIPDPDPSSPCLKWKFAWS